MKTTLLATTAAAAFVCSYFFNLAMENSEQYLAVVAVIFMDGFFGVIAGTKREGFKTYKAVRILKTLTAWSTFCCKERSNPDIFFISWSITLK